MTQKQFMVVILPKENGNPTRKITLPRLFDDYEDAWDYMDELIAETANPTQPMPLPNRRIALRVETDDANVELWIINRVGEELATEMVLA